MGCVSVEDVVVGLVVAAALVFLVRRFVGPPAKPKKQGPDVPLSRLTRRDGRKKP